MDEKRLMERLAGVAGILFAILFVVGAVMAETPDPGQPAKWVTWFSDSGHRSELIVNGYLWVLAGLCMAIMIAALYQRFGSREGVAGLYANIAGLAAIIFTAVLLVAGVGNASVAGNVAFGGANVPQDGDLLVQLGQQGMAFVLLAGGLSAALALAAVSLLIMREDGPRWLAVLGFIAAICCIFGVVFIPMIALPIWMICASIVLLTRKSAAGVRRSAPVPAA